MANSNRKQFIPLSIFIIICVITLLGCIIIYNRDATVTSRYSDGNPDGLTEMNNLDIKDNPRVYLKDNDDSVQDLYVTIKKSVDNERNYTLDELNDDQDTSDGGKPAVEVIMQEGNDKGPQPGYFGFGQDKANGVMQLRGMSARDVEQKSYAITLFNNSGLWKGLRRINLNKHQADITRIRNKLSFDFLKTIPDITSCRTQFVHLHIKDLTNNSSEFVDYGLFTQVEQVNKKYLKSHGLDPNGYLYKAMDFEFYRYEDSLKNVDDEGYDKKAFESILEIKGREDHKKLLTMLDDVNDYSKDINEIIKNHFNRNNYLTWLAANILLDNVDTYAQNFFLYSPMNSDIWYFLPWDYDGAWGLYEQSGKMLYKRTPWQGGASNFWSSVLYQRFMKDPENVKQLTEKIKSLKKIINRANTNKLLDNYYSIAKKSVYSMPDIQYLPGKVDDFEKEFKRLSELPELNMKHYLNSLEKPMPFYLGEPESIKGKYNFRWDSSYDFGGNALTYCLEVSLKPDFSEDYFKKEGLTSTDCSIDKPPQGKYYWRVTAVNSKGKEQMAFDKYIDDIDNSKVYFGVKSFTVE
ncbi:MAG: CotH kinase family protein [Bacillota bacterium]|nr:CotH kinase family protein [Bacillota bacterium]